MDIRGIIVPNQRIFLLTTEFILSLGRHRPYIILRRICQSISSVECCGSNQRHTAYSGFPNSRWLQMLKCTPGEWVEILSTSEKSVTFMATRSHRCKASGMKKQYMSIKNWSPEQHKINSSTDSGDPKMGM